MKKILFTVVFLLITLSASQTILAGRYYDSETRRFLAVDPLSDKYPGCLPAEVVFQTKAGSPYNYTMNNPLRFVDPDGRSIWEKIKNMVTKGEWRDDTIQENFDQKDWENATPQVAEKAKIDMNKVDVTYDSKDKIARFKTEKSKDGKYIKVTTTKNGFELLAESKVDNAINAMEHEKKHTEQPKVASGNKNARKQQELEAISYQRKQDSWKKTTPSFKTKIKKYEKYIKNKNN